MTFRDAFTGYAQWVWRDVSQPGVGSYFTLLVVVTGFWLVVEQIVPWRRQPRLREGFWLDAFYLAFNFYGFGLLGFQALATVAHEAFLGLFGDPAVVRADDLPVWMQLATYLVLRDLVQYGIHRTLHRVPFLWRFHRVHHSVREMGVAANLRFHPMETVVYRSLELVPMSLVGFGVEDWFAVHAFSLFVGHWNHANVRIPLGPLRYVLNHPQMHHLHHAKDVPDAHGVNYGVVLSVWDWLLGTAWLPDERGDHALGFDGVEAYPRGFLAQLAEPLTSPSPATAPETS